VLAADQTADGDIAEQTLPEGLYAICRVEIRDDEFAATWQAFCAGWLPSSGYRPAGGPSFERYLESRYQRGDGRWLLELCIPIQPR
jgi:DNA gyrase inhibitor GyrI